MGSDKSLSMIFYLSFLHCNNILLAESAPPSLFYHSNRSLSRKKKSFIQKKPPPQFMRFPHPPPLSFPFTHRPLYTYSSYPTFGQLLKNTVEALRFYIPIDLSCTTNGIKAMNSSTRQRGERLFIFFLSLFNFIGIISQIRCVIRPSVS